MKTKQELIPWRHSSIWHQKQSYRAFFNGGISKHQAQINQNEAQVIFFTFWILKVQLHFVGSVNREVRTTIDYPTLN